jgi:hypothetical protein
MLSKHEAVVDGISTTHDVGCFHPRVPETSLNLGVKYKQDRPFLSIQGLAAQATFVLSIASRPIARRNI